MSKLAEIYLKGLGGEKQLPEKAMEFLNRAAAQDYPSAPYRLGNFYLFGKCGVKQDGQKAVEYLIKDFEENDSWETRDEIRDMVLGDGDKNIKTLHRLTEHKKRKNIIFLRGNVDETYIHGLFDSNGNFFFKPNSKVARAIKTTSFKEPYFPQEIYDFLTDLPLYHSVTVGGRKYFFCHAGIKVDAPLNAQPKSYLLNHPELRNFYVNYSGKAVIVVGHKSPKKIFGSSEKYNLNLPLKIPGRNILMPDTGAKEDGQLSCVDILSGEFWQSDTAQVDSILFVCSGNSCRSPMAKYIMRHLLKQNDLSEKIFVDSAGCNTYGGNPMSKMAREEDMLLQAEEISEDDPDNKIRLFTEGDGRNIKVKDPFHADNPRKAYSRAYEQIYLGCSSLIKQLNIN